MTKNMGKADRTIRIVLAIGIAVAFFTGRISGTLAIILGVVVIALLVTSVVGWCPAYIPFGLSTRKKAPGSTGP